MTLYAIGDIQGCARAFSELLGAIDFDPGSDELWLVGDLVNRGPASLEVLREVIGLGDRATVVLGNHDLHLLASAAGVRQPQPGDTFATVLGAPDAGNILDWLRGRPLLHFDEARDRALVHAGIPPAWSVRDALTYANEVAASLRGPGWTGVLADMYGDEPRRWSERSSGSDRTRYVINALTRMRYCYADGGLDFEHTGPPGTQPAGLRPWFDYPDRRSADTHIVFGHWASLGLVRRNDVTALDSGCVWGGSLTALPLDPPGDPVAVDCQGAVVPD
ncbi:MAG TPA: symmetrical bis(5'-nucleosyl)-tetraphosphatase [Gammaproteobacteria bacterium]